MKFLMVFFFLISALGGSFESHAETNTTAIDIAAEKAPSSSLVAADCDTNKSSHSDEPCSDNCHTHSHCHCMFLPPNPDKKVKILVRAPIFSRSKLRAGSFLRNLFRPPIS